MNPSELANIERAEQSQWWYRGMHGILVRLLDPVAKQRGIRRVLEAGCGTGYVAWLLGRRYGWRVFPMDLEAEAVGLARRRGLDGVVQADAVRLPFSGGSLDAVVSLDMFVHLPPGGEAAALQEFSRVLKPGGVLLLRAAAFHWLRSRHSVYVHEVQRFTRRQLASLARAGGLTILRATYANSLLLPVAFTKFRIWEELRRAPASSGLDELPKWLDRLLYLPLALESRWLGAGLNLPLGQSVILLAEKRPRVLP